MKLLIEEELGVKVLGYVPKLTDLNLESRHLGLDVYKRQAVSMVVGRDTEVLDDIGVTKAAVETVAENASDGVIAPLLFLMIGGAPLGLSLIHIFRKADLLIGARRMLDTVQTKGADPAFYEGKQEFAAYEPRKIADYLELHPEYGRAVILLSGDIGFYSGAKKLYEVLDPQNYEVKSLCGISRCV